MSWLSNIGKAVKKGVVDVGHFAGKVASNPIVTGAAGVLGGPLAGALVGGAGRLLKPGGNLGSAAQGALAGGIAGAAPRLLGRGGLGGAIKGTLGGNLGGLLGRTSTSTMGQDQVPGRIVDFDEGGNPIYAGDLDAGAIMGGGGGGGGGFGGFLSGAGRLLGAGLGGLTGGQGGGLSLGNLALGGLAGYQALNAANASKRAGQLQDKALGIADQRWNDAAPLRAAGQSRLLNPTKPDLSAVFANPSNPFASSQRVLRR